VTAWQILEKETPENTYHLEYFNRLSKLKYPFLSSADPAETALRFTLSQPGVHTAIVGTTNPERFSTNAGIVARGPLAEVEMVAIRKRWQEVAHLTWTGQI
jgi:aryl-alcohol dehydrogenase-like predicted oxidoreductase